MHLESLHHGERQVEQEHEHVRDVQQDHRGEHVEVEVTGGQEYYRHQNDHQDCHQARMEQQKMEKLLAEFRISASNVKVLPNVSRHAEAPMVR